MYKNKFFMANIYFAIVFAKSLRGTHGTGFILASNVVFGLVKVPTPFHAREKGPLRIINKFSLFLNFLSSSCNFSLSC